ncbi:toxin C-terminal domain-containing protein [Paenibacillus oleatilyticus]|uniref:toxin C-terminal domain-containing protein n=1 Tax=Paenibacillus oleatilyticus TaxID=2594886 RepID=UPI0020A7372D|nr:toxin C-terminal domain-containing protein [Paenibacillus oleatilyticus]
MHPIVFSSEKDMEITSDTKVEIKAKEAIYLMCSTSSMILDGEVDLQAQKIEMVGLTKAPVVVEDLPQEEEEEEQEEEESGWGGFLDGLQLGLDLVGLIPGLGEIADLANAGISLARGDYAGAALSLAACIPFAGWGATGAKLGMKAQKVVTKGKKVAKATENATSATKKAKAIVKNKSPGNGRGKVRTAARNAKEDMSELEAVQKMKDGMLAKAMQKPAVQKSIEIGKEVALEVGMELLDEATGGVASLAFGVAGSRRGRKTGGSASGSGTGRSEPQATQKDRSPDKDQANEQKLRKVANGDSDYSGEVPKKGDTNKKSGGGNGQDTEKPPSKPPEGEGTGNSTDAYGGYYQRKQQRTDDYNNKTGKWTPAKKTSPPNGPYRTDREAEEAANILGFEKANGGRAKAAVFYSEERGVYITRDIPRQSTGSTDNSGVWKMANTIEELMIRQTRLRTYDKNLNRIGD